jgi:hypothetical protein
MGKYSLKLSQNVPNAGGYYNMIKIGLPLEREMVNDLCICAEGTYDFIPVNRIILRQALLNNPEFTKRVLGIEVKDATIKKEEEKPTKKVAKKGEAK